jgi:hypothetical protein
MANAVNRYRWKLYQIGQDFEIGSLEQILAPLGDAIDQCAETINRASTSKDAQCIEIVNDDETAFIENLLGTAFVVCQTYITCAVSRVISLHKLCQESSGFNLTTTTGTRTSIMQLGSRFLPQSPYTKVEAIDAFANYFKHREQWHGPWEQLPDPACRTAQIVTACGALQYSTGNFRTLAGKLGNGTYSNLSAFSKILQSWRQTVYEQYKAELHSKGLI